MSQPKTRKVCQICRKRAWQHISLVTPVVRMYLCRLCWRAIRCGEEVVL